MGKNQGRKGEITMNKLISKFIPLPVVVIALLYATVSFAASGILASTNKNGYGKD